MNTTTHIDLLTGFIFIGVLQGLVLSLFFIFKTSPNSEANRFQGLLLLALSLSILEQFLNLTGYITKVLVVTNSTEPLSLVIGPFLYLFVKRSLNEPGSKKEWLHFIPAILYLCYLSFDLIQPDVEKYNLYVYSFHPDWPKLQYHSFVSNDPLNLKKFLNPVTAFQILLYVFLASLKLIKQARQSAESIFRTNDEVLKSLRNMVLHILIIILIFIIVKTTFQRDLGDYFMGLYMSFIAILTSFKVMNDSAYFARSTSFMDINIQKYTKSSLTETDKQKILNNLLVELETRHYYSDNLASLSELAKKVGESSHHVSQVINEKLNKSFFEVLAFYRVEDAKKIFTGDKENKLTIEEISEMVGYNSKTAFNNAFKKLSGKTPSEFRKTVNT